MRKVLIFFDANRRAIACEQRPAKFCTCKTMLVRDGQKLKGKLDSEILAEARESTEGARMGFDAGTFRIHDMGENAKVNMFRGIPNGDQGSRKARAVLRSRSYSPPETLLARVSPRAESRGATTFSQPLFARDVPQTHTTPTHRYMPAPISPAD